MVFAHAEQVSTPNMVQLAPGAGSSDVEVQWQWFDSRICPLYLEGLPL